MAVVIGVDGAGRTHRLGAIAAAATGAVTAIDGTGDDPAGQLAAARDGGHLVVVDDADRLPAEMLTALTAAARQGVPMAISRRPTLDSPELAALDEVVAADGQVETLTPLDDDGVAAVVAAVTGGQPSPEAVVRMREASAGLPAVVAMLAGAPPDTSPPALVARVQQRLARMPAGTADLARILSFGLDLPDEVLATATDLDPDALAAAMRRLHDYGMLVPGGEPMIPAVAQAVQADLPPPGRRRLHEAVARALLDTGADPLAAAAHLRAARARTPAAATVYATAGERLRFDDPATAATWYDLACDAGAGQETVAAGRAESAALLGRPVPLEAKVGTPEDAARLTLVAGAVAAHQGRCDRAGETLRGAPPPGPVLAVPSLVATGRLTEATAAATTGTAPLGLRRLAEACLAVTEPEAALPLLIEAAEELEHAPPAMVLPDTAHAIAAVVAVLAGDVATAEHLLERALTGEPEGTVAGQRHRLLLAWTRLRAGRYDTAMELLPHLDPAGLGGRERLLTAALSAGLARRSGDIAQLRQAWTAAEPVLARRAVDLLQVEAVEELLVAAARLREHQRIHPVLQTLDSALGGLGRPPAWAVAVGWVRLQVAVAGEDVDAASEAASQLATCGAGSPRQRAQCTAAQRWASALAGEVDHDAVVAAADDLAAVQLPWEGSRLAGHAAIRTTDPIAARRLLEHARELASVDALTAATSASSVGGLSDREAEVARLVLAGRTHKEIGAQLYLSPKTVEHHVARIRTKVGATSRAELIAALRRLLPDVS